MSRKVLVLLVLSLGFLSSHAQIGGKKTKSGVTINGMDVKPGDTLFLGKGSDLRGNFVYIYQPANFLLGAAETALPRNWANTRFVIKHFKDQSTKKFGNKIVAVISPGGLNFVADIEAAAASGEIVAINSTKVGASQNAQMALPSSTVADELKKMKELLDSGAITQEEYAAAKKKILNQ